MNPFGHTGDESISADGTLLLPLKTRDGTEQADRDLDRQRREALDHAQLNATLLAGVLDSTPDMVFCKDLQGHYLACNPEFIRFMGHPREQILGRTDYEFFPKVAADFFREHDRKALDAERPLHNEEWVTYPDGARRLLDTVKAPLRTAEGRVIGIIGVSRNITDRFNMEAALAASDARLRGIFDTVVEGIFQSTPEGRYVVVNPAFARMFGYDSPEQMMREVTDIRAQLYANPAERDRLLTTVQSEGVVRGWEVHGRRRDGRCITVSINCSLIRDEQGRPRYFEGTVEDVTDRRRAEQALRESEENLLALINATPDIICFKDAEGRWLKANDSILKLHCLEGVDYRGHTESELAEFTAPIFREAFRNCAGSDEAAWNAGGLSRTEETIPDADGHLRVYDVIKIPLFRIDGSRKGIVVFGRDITGLRRAETEKEKLHAQFLQSQKMEGIGRLAGGVAHDFNNLLQTILGYADILIEHIPPGAPLRPDIEEIRNAGRRAADLTRQLLAFGRKQMLKARVTDLNALVANVGRMLHRTIGEDVLLHTETDQDLPRVMADPGQIEQILLNLAVNARDAMPGGGRLVFATSHLDIGPDDLPMHPEGRCGRFVCCSVTDTGCGMTPEVMSHLFEPFYTTKPQGKGTGLGLATAYGITRQHEGWIQVHSRIGHGSTFRIYLPAIDAAREMPAASPDSTPPPEPLPPRGAGQLVLYVEDESAVRRLVQTLLENNGYHVLAVGNASAALAIVEHSTTRPDLLLCDVVLPDLNGLDLADRILHLLPNLRVLICSGYADQEHRWPRIRERRWAFLGKPFSASSLLGAIASVLRRAP